MNHHIAKVMSMVYTGLCLVFACSLASPRMTAQSAPSAITLEPPAGQELQAHTLDGQGNRLPEAPANFRRLGEAHVGESADIHTLTFRFAETAKLTGIKSTRDFKIERGGSCEAGNTYQKGSACTLLVRFTPQGTGNRLGRVTISTNLSVTPLAFGLGGYGYAPIVSFVPSIINTVPGSYPGSVGLLSGAQNLTIDAGDTLWVSDTGNGLVRNLDSGGVFKTPASGYTGVLGIAVDTFGQAYFDVPSTGKMYEIYDYGPVVQVSGTGSASCPAATPCSLSAQALGTPGEMSMDGYNHLFFVDSHQGAAFSTVQPIPANLIYLYDPFPYQTSPSSAMAVDSGDNLYSLWANGGVCEIAQQSLYNAENSNVSFNKIAGGHTCGFSGDGGLAGNAEIGNKIGQIAFDTAGDMYFTDTANQRVRRIDYTTGIIRTIAGNGTAGYSGDGASATSATLNTPTGVAVDSQGQIYIISSASSGQVIRKVGPNGYANFGSVLKGSSSPVQTVTVSNTGNTQLQLVNTMMTGANPGDFKVDPSTTNCPLTPGVFLSAGQTCRIGFTFAPTAAGARTASFVLLDSSISGSDTIILNGTGALPPAVTLSPTSLSFGSVAVGATLTLPVTVTNSGQGGLTFNSVTHTGTDASSFSHTSNCGATIPPGGSCTIQVSFHPTSPANYSATLRLDNNAPDSPQLVSTTGTGSGAVMLISPSPVSFSNVVAGSTATVPVTVTNTGNTGLAFASITHGGANPSLFSHTSNCGQSTVAAGASCTIQLSFRPTTNGSFSSTLVVTTNATNSPLTVNVNATAVSSAKLPVLHPTPIKFGTLGLSQ
jgi:Abnormal spindle-like microcephaly-assoc'd, ASPM-SPD-2-Hydin